MTEERKDFDWGGPAVRAGLPDDFDGLIVSSIFQEGDYGPQLAFSLKVLDPEYSGDNPNAWFSMGSGDFVILDGGLRIGGDQYKMWSKLDLLIETLKKINAKIPPGNEASVFEGLTFHWVRKKLVDVAEYTRGQRRPYPPKPDGEPPDMLIPNKYLGKREIVVETPAEAADDATIGKIFTDILKERSPLRWPGLMLKSTAQHPEHKAVIIEKGRAILASLVDIGTLTEEDGAYSPGIEF